MKIKNGLGKPADLRIRKQQGNRRVMIPLKDEQGNQLPFINSQSQDNDISKDEDNRVAFPADKIVAFDIAGIKENEWPLSISIFQQANTNLLSKPIRIRDIQELVIEGLPILTFRLPRECTMEWFLY